MNAHSLTWADHAKFRWSFKRTARQDMSNAIKVAALPVIILAVLGITGRMDYEDALRAEAVRQEADTEAARAQLIACLNAGNTGLYSVDADGNRHFIVCDKPFFVSDENVKS